MPETSLARPSISIEHGPVTDTGTGSIAINLTYIVWVCCCNVVKRVNDEELIGTKSADGRRDDGDCWRRTTTTPRCFAVRAVDKTGDLTVNSLETRLATCPSQTQHTATRRETEQSAIGRGSTSDRPTALLGQLSLASLRGRLIEYQLRLG